LEDIVEELLDRLEKWLAKKRKRFLKALNPGASPAALTKLKKALGCPLPDELQTLLAWHDGQSPESKGKFEESWLLLSAERINAAKADLDAGAGETGWNAKWVPFLEDDQGDYLCLDTAKKGVPVRGFYLGNTEHEIVAASLTAWFEDFVTAVEAGKYHEESERGDFLRKSQAK
jgi:cell wall assembly regulator SMI1